MGTNRIVKLRQLFDSLAVDAFFISNYYNIFYLTGFKTLTDDEREAFVLLTKKNTYLFTDGRYTYADPEIILKLLEPGKGLFFHLGTIFEEDQVKSFGIESEDLRVHEYEKLKSMFGEIRILPLESTVMKLRAVKEEGEIQKIKKACEITDRCLKEITPTIAIGKTEKELAFKIEQWIKKQGYDLAFDPIVAVDKNSAIPHYHTKEGNGIIKEDSIVLLDFGVKYDHYLSDITRMLFFHLDDRMTQTYQSLLEVQKKTIEFLAKEKNAKSVDAFCRTSLQECHLPDFPHSLGHGVGLEIHEYPKLSKNSGDVLIDNNVFTVEPGVYYGGRWGMRIEDSVTVKNGKPEVLTKFNKDVVILS